MNKRLTQIREEFPTFADPAESSESENGQFGDSTVLSVNNISKKFCKNLRRSMGYGVIDLTRDLFGVKANTGTLRKDEFWALDGINFELKRGEALGLIGVNGSGKTTLLRLIAGLFPPDKGEIMVSGRVGALISVGAGFHPHLSGRENIYLNGSILGMSQLEIERSFDEIVDFAELGDFIDAPISTYSSGMRVRLGFSIATAIEPDILLLDEILAVGDMGFRAKCFQRIGQILESSAVIYVSHDMTNVSRVCDRAILLRKGRIFSEGSTESVIEDYLNELRDRNTAFSESRTVLHPSVEWFSCQANKSTYKYGELLELELIIDSIVEIQTGICLVALSAIDSYHCQTDFSRFMPAIPYGRSVFKLAIGPLNLRKDKYDITVTIMEKTGKNTRIHAIKCATIEVSGDRGYGVPYQVPVVSGQFVKSEM